MNHKAIRESARRLLKTSSVVIYSNSNQLESIHSLILSLGDSQPKFILNPNFHTIDDARHVFFSTTDDLDIQLSGEEPNLEVCWVKGELEDILPRFYQDCLELVQAGYPGCIGCGGPGSEIKWNERSSREGSR